MYFQIDKKMKSLKEEQQEIYMDFKNNESIEDRESETEWKEDAQVSDGDDDSSKESDMSEGEVEEDDSGDARSNLVDNAKANKKCMYKRNKKECPFSTCSAKVFHLPRHLRNVHKWSKESARTALQHFNIRKLPEKKGSKKDYHIRKRCPVIGCTSVVKRMSDHLLRVHKLNKSGKTYKDYMKSATRARSGEHMLQIRKTEYKKRKLEMNLVESCEEELEENVEDQFCANEWQKSKDDTCRKKKRYDGREVRKTQYQTSEEEEEGEFSNGDNLSSTDSQSDCDDCLSDCSDVKLPDQEINDGSNNEYLSESLFTFKTWMESADGGKNDDKTANQHMKQLKRILEIIDEELELSSLLDYKKIRDTFITEHAEKNYHPKTIKSYIMSIRHFLSYLLSDEPVSIPFDRTAVIMLRERLQRWTKSYKKDCHKREWQKKKNDRDRLVTPSMIGEFEKSKAARDAIIILGQLSGAHSREITQADYTLVRDFLFAEIAIDNANRAGVVANMTVNEFEKAVPMEDGESFIVEVMRHKTLESKGPANVVLSKKLHSWLKIFQTELRTKVSEVEKGSGVVEFFLSWHGRKLESSQINKALKSVWKKAEMAGPICSTDFRKSAVTEVHTNHMGYASNLADLLDHNETTARKYYRLTEKNNVSLKASKHLARVMRSEGCKSQAKTEAAVLGKEFEVDKEASQESLGKESPTLKIPWTSEAEETLKSVFAEEIQHCKVTMECVRQKIANIPILAKEDARRVLHKVRSQWRHPNKATEYNRENECLSQPPADCETQEQLMNRMFDADKESENSIISPTVETCSSKGIFSQLHREIIFRLFGDMITKACPISRNVIREKLESEPQGKQLLSAMSMFQINNRIKYERRMYRERK